MGHRPSRVAARIGTVLAIALLATTAIGSPALAATVTVRIGHSLDPAALRVTPGTTVTWVNADDERHRVRSTAGPVKFDSGNLEPGERFTVRFTTEGRWRYLDDRNRDLERYWGTVSVAASPADDAGGGASAGAGSTSSGGGAAAPTRVEVGMAGRAFSPRSVTIVAGATVRWMNDDDREHTVSATGGAFDSGVLGGGDAFSETFRTAGTYRYLCAIHPEMTGTISVTGTSGAAPAPPAATPTLAPTPTPTPAPAAPDAGAVAIVDLAFTPDDLEVAPGTTVTWRNDGAAMHTVTAGDGSFDSGFLAAGDSWSHRFDEAGSFAYVCSLHPGMTGRVVVGEAVPAGAIANPSGAPSVSPASAATPTAPPEAVVAPAAATSPEPDPVPAASVTSNAEPSGGADGLRLVLVAMLAIGSVAVFFGIVRATVEPGR